MRRSQRAGASVRFDRTESFTEVHDSEARILELLARFRAERIIP